MSCYRLNRLLRAAAVLTLAVLAACSPRTTTEGQPSPGYGAGVTAEGDVLTRAQIDAIGAVRTTELFENRFAGVQVATRGGVPRIVIRGYSDPLIVIDGTPQGSDTQPLWSLSPRDIERIEILRDAGTISYGPRGAHGVVVVTTRPRK